MIVGQFDTAGGKCAPKGGAIATGERAWSPAVALSIEALLESDIAGRAAVFDFDGTIITGDITESVVATCWERGLLDTEAFFSVLGKGEHKVNPFDTYRSLADMDTADGYPHGHHAASPLLAQCFSGCALTQVVEMTRTTLVRPTITFPPPEPRENVVHLIAALQAAGVACWILSAGVTWCVRTMVMDVINPMLVGIGGEAAQLDPARVVGVSTLMRQDAIPSDPADSDELFWWSDRRLIDSPLGVRYLTLDRGLLSSLVATSAVVGPVTFGGGKVGAWSEISPNSDPVLMVGDGAGDVPLMRRADHALWLAPTGQSGLPPGLPHDAWIHQV